MENLSIIGTSNIIIQHLKAIKKTKLNLISIYSTRKNISKISKIAKQYKIKKIFLEFDKFLEYANSLNSHFLIAPRIRDNEKILHKVISKTYKTKIFIEKPIFTKSIKFELLKKNNSRIFVGYNRCFYKNVEYLKSLNFKNAVIQVNCTENSISEIRTNTCHLISILIYLFGKIKLISRYRDNRMIYCSFKDKNNNLINITIYFNVLINFSINFYLKNKLRIELSPIEQIKIYDKIIKKNSKYYLNIKKNFNENTKIKPGFLKQIKTFENFCLNKKTFNDIFFAQEVMKVCEKIIG